jgi:pimeloyl-ACP methyl ester carboxylesterase
MQEQAFRFGRARHLVGIAGLPPSTTPERVGVIVLNAGLVHRIGPFRMHVEMTRRLNAYGYPTLRFDLSTIGDSAASGESQTRKQQICADVGDAMNLLGEQAACKRFVLIGLCSGSQSAHMVACSDPKVAGAVFLDGYAYRTLGYHLRYYLPRLLDVQRWRRRMLARRRQAPAAGSDEPTFTVAPLPQATVRADLAGMLDRGLKLCLIYSGGISRYFNHARQFRECFGRVVSHPGVFTRFLKEADHTYILTGDRNRLLDNVERWLSENFPVTADGSS